MSSSNNSPDQIPPVQSSPANPPGYRNQLADQGLQSPFIHDLALCLSKAQSEFLPISKSKTAEVVMKSGGKYTYSYADLADVIEATRPALTKHGLCLTHLMAQEPGRGYLLRTMLIHQSGQWIMSVYQLPGGKTPQELGSEITYARRYSVSSMLGVAAEDDDDGARASAPRDPRGPGRENRGGDNKPQQPAGAPVQPARGPSPVKPRVETRGPELVTPQVDARHPGADVSDLGTLPLTTPQLQELSEEIGQGKAWSKTQAQSWVRDMYGKSTLVDLNRGEYLDMSKAMRATKAAPNPHDYFELLLKSRQRTTADSSAVSNPGHVGDSTPGVENAATGLENDLDQSDGFAAFSGSMSMS